MSSSLSESSSGIASRSGPPDPAITEISRARIAQLYPGCRPIVFRVLQDIRIQTNRTANIAQGLRTFDEQLATYAKGRELVGSRWVVKDMRQIVTNALPGHSFHCYGLAWDVSLTGGDPYLQAEPKDAQEAFWSAYGAIIRGNGAKWGGDFHLINGVSDKPHGEMTWGLTVADCLELYQHGGIPAVWAYLDKHRGVPEGDGWRLPSGDLIHA